MIRIILPPHLRTLAGTGREVSLTVREPVTLRGVVDALEAAYPPLRGTVRDLNSGERRAFLRFFAEGEDISLQAPDDPLSAAVAGGTEPLWIVGAIVGG